jgi:hypothetical protein
MFISVFTFSAAAAANILLQQAIEEERPLFLRIRQCCLRDRQFLIQL